MATATLNIICYNNIKFGQNTLIGWDVTIMDTDLHRLKRFDNNPIISQHAHYAHMTCNIQKSSAKGYAPIRIGDNCWIGMKTTILKGINLPNNCVVASCSILSKNLKFKSNQLIGSNLSMRVIKEGIFRDPKDDGISYDD